MATMNLTKLTNYSIGLTDKEVLESREKHGMNLLTPPKKASMWKLYLEKFNDPVIRILLVAAFFSLVISIIEGEYAETIGIFFAIFLATGIGFYFEYDATSLTPPNASFTFAYAAIFCSMLAPSIAN